MKSLKIAALLAGMAFVATPAFAVDTISNTLGSTTVGTDGTLLGTALTSTNNNTVGSTGTFGKIDSTGDALATGTAPTISGGVNNKMSIASIGAASSASAETTVNVAAATAVSTTNNADVVSIDATNSLTGDVTNTGTVYGAQISAGGGNSISIQSVGASSGLSTTTVYLP